MMMWPETSFANLSSSWVKVVMVSISPRFVGSIPQTERHKATICVEYVPRAFGNVAVANVHNVILVPELREEDYSTPSTAVPTVKSGDLHIALEVDFLQNSFAGQKRFVESHKSWEIGGLDESSKLDFVRDISSDVQKKEGETFGRESSYQGFATGVGWRCMP